MAVKIASNTQPPQENISKYDKLLLEREAKALKEITQKATAWELREGGADHFSVTPGSIPKTDAGRCYFFIMYDHSQGKDESECAIVVSGYNDEKNNAREPLSVALTSLDDCKIFYAVYLDDTVRFLVPTLNYEGSNNEQKREGVIQFLKWVKGKREMSIRLYMDNDLIDEDTLYVQDESGILDKFNNILNL